MSFSTVRRIPAALLALVLTAGLIAHGIGVPGAVAKPDMVVANDMPMSGNHSGNCNGCAGKENGVVPAACAAFCGAAFTLPVIDVILYAVPAERMSPRIEPAAIGRADPPDPYPPRATILA